MEGAVGILVAISRVSINFNDDEEFSSILTTLVSSEYVGSGYR
jgi:uncharacterized membrane protein